MGRMLLPMHIPVLLSGFVLAPFSAYGGSDFPILSCLLTNMPPVSRLAFMVIELAGYGFMSGLLFRTLKLYKTRYGTALSLAPRYSKAFVRSFYLSPQTFWGFLKLDPSRRGKRSLRINRIVIQIILVPTIIYLLRKIRVIDPADTQKKRTKQRADTQSLKKEDLHMTDELQKAVSKLHDSGCAIVVANGEKVIASAETSLKPLIEIVKTSPEILRGAAVADKIVGKGSRPPPCAFGSGKCTRNLSDFAVPVLERAGIQYHYNVRAPL